MTAFRSDILFVVLSDGFATSFDRLLFLGDLQEAQMARGGWVSVGVSQSEGNGEFVKKAIISRNTRFFANLLCSSVLTREPDHFGATLDSRRCVEMVKTDLVNSIKHALSSGGGLLAEVFWQ